jgi:hypothetical protein
MVRMDGWMDGWTYNGWRRKKERERAMRRESTLQV